MRVNGGVLYLFILLAISCERQGDLDFELAWDYYAFPDIAASESGKVFCVFYRGWSHASNPMPDRYTPFSRGGYIMFTKSLDGGLTWLNPIKLLDDSCDERDPSITVLSNGTIVCSYSSVCDGNLFTKLVTSLDEGNTWNSPITVAYDYLCSSPVLELSNGNLVIGLFNEKFDKEEIVEAHGATSFSKDMGNSWSTPVRIPSDPKLIFDAETSVIEGTPGYLYAVLRTSDLNRNMHYSLSEDFGNSWQLSRDIGFPGHCPYLFRISADSVLLAHRFPATSLRLSVDNCKTWSDAIKVSDATGAYPSIARISNNRYLIAYYDDNFKPSLSRSFIRFKQFIFEDGVLKWIDFSSTLGEG